MIKFLNIWFCFANYSSNPFPDLTSIFQLIKFTYPIQIYPNNPSTTLIQTKCKLATSSPNKTKNFTNKFASFSPKTNASKINSQTHEKWSKWTKSKSTSFQKINPMTKNSSTSFTTTASKSKPSSQKTPLSTKIIKNSPLKYLFSYQEIRHRTTQSVTPFLTKIHWGTTKKSYTRIGRYRQGSLRKNQIMRKKPSVVWRNYRLCRKK